MAGRILVASNRGPVRFVEQDGELVPVRGSGGLVAALGEVGQTSGGRWVAAAMSEEDRARAAAAPEGRIDVVHEDSKHALRLLTFDEETYRGFYHGISNRLLWFCYHQLWELGRGTVFDEATREAWEAYREVNRTFARALGEEADGGATVLVQDYHLSLVPAELRRLAPGVRIAYFHHVPFPGPEAISLLPTWLREELLRGLLGADVVGFQADRWAEGFLSTVSALRGVEVEDNRVQLDDRTVTVGVYPITVDTASLRDASSQPAVLERRASLERLRHGRQLLLRVDRTEPSKNVVRGFLAFEDLLQHRPEWRERVVFLALLNPSRTELPEYRSYVDECRHAADRINAEYGTSGWRPVDLRIDDDIDTVLAAYGLYDVLLVNPVIDGMNLVAKEGPILNERDGVLVLSRGAGAHAELGRSAVSVDPLDVAGTAEALHAALSMDRSERGRRAERLRTAAAAGSPTEWVKRQLADLSS